jgi:hypothetical protein
LSRVGITSPRRSSSWSFRNLVERDAAGRLTLADQGQAVLAALLPAPR